MTNVTALNTTCPIHEDVLLAMYCHDCCQLCCSKCSETGAHKDHKVTSAKESGELLKQVLETVMPGLDKTTEILVQIVASLDEKSASISEEATRVRDSIQTAFTTIREAIDTREKELLSIVEAKCGEISEEYLSLYQKANDSICPQIHDDVNELLENWDDKNVDFATAGKMIRESKDYVKKATELNEEWLSFQGREDLISFKGDESVMNIINSISSFDNIQISTGYKAPEEFTLLHTGSSLAYFKWKVDKYVTKYCIYKKLKSSDNFESSSSWEGKGGECMLKNLKPDTEYAFCIKAVYSKDRLSKPSDTIIARTATNSTCVQALEYSLASATSCESNLKRLKFAVRDKTNASKAVKEGAIEVILEIFKLYVDNVMISYLSLSILNTILSYNDEECKKIVKIFDIVEPVAAAMNEHKDNFYVYVSGVGVMCSLACIAEMRPSILRNLNFKDLVENARDYIGDTKLCKAINVTIGNTLICDEADKKHIFGSNAEKLMIDIIINHMNEKDICHGAACTLTNIICLSDDFSITLGEVGAIEVFDKLLNLYKDDELVCPIVIKCLGLVNIPIANKRISAKVGIIGTLIKLLKEWQNKNDLKTLKNLYRAIRSFSDTRVNRAIIDRSGVVEYIMKDLAKYKSDEEFCRIFCWLLSSISIESYSKVSILNVFESIKAIVQAYPENEEVCHSVSSAIWSIVEGSTEIQNIACSNNIPSLLLDILKIPDADEKTAGSVVGALGSLFSSSETLSKYCNSDVFGVVEECCKKYSESDELKMHLLGLKREEDPRVRDAISRGVCTKDAFPKCSDDCMCDENFFCEKCFVQQKVFRCLECDKDVLNLYCEVCWNKAHKGHKCEEFFYPNRCVGLHDK